ncbi:MAG: indole-3-glycerol phosphate synthase TrpC, partial [Candidatus Omnitrophota bacterium]
MILDSIVRHKKKEIKLLKAAKPLRRLIEQVSRLGRKKPVFRKALESGRPVAVIAEIKRKSPSKGVLRRNFRPDAIARGYARGGAKALSVLTDRKFFGGSEEALRKVRSATRLPILRKDFIIDEYQVYESRLIGADAVLFIAGILPAAKLERLAALAKRLGLDRLFEVHTAGELRKVLRVKPDIVGINNRDLRTFRVDMKVTEKLVRQIPRNVLVVSESGIQNHRDL